MGENFARRNLLRYLVDRPEDHSSKGLFIIKYLLKKSYNYFQIKGKY
jgi:hypothetical protein